MAKLTYEMADLEEFHWEFQFLTKLTSTRCSPKAL